MAALHSRELEQAIEQAGPWSAVVYAFLPTLCDRAGRFRWDVREIGAEMHTRRHGACIVVVLKALIDAGLISVYKAPETDPATGAQLTRKGRPIVSEFGWITDWFGDHYGHDAQRPHPREPELHPPHPRDRNGCLFYQSKDPNGKWQCRYIPRPTNTFIEQTNKSAGPYAAYSAGEGVAL